MQKYLLPLEKRQKQLIFRLHRKFEMSHKLLTMIGHYCAIACDPELELMLSSIDAPLLSQ